MDVRIFNCWIITRDREYLQAVEPNTKKIVFSRYIFDSYGMDRETAQILARRICGFVKPFNHVTGVYVK